MNEYDLGIIGGGNMAEALLRGVITSNFLSHNSIVVSDPDFKRRQHLTHSLGVQCVQDNHAPAGCRRVVLAVKPQVIGGVLEEITPDVQADGLVVSIAAGIATSFIDAKLGGRGHLVRVMPNTPMLVGAGVSAIAAGARATDEDVRWTQKLLSASGRTVVVGEDLMDAVTAVSGSGPAYFFYLVEAMIAAGVAEGLDPDVAKMLAVETCAGAAKLLIDTQEPPEGLRARVTSPGGTTQRAVETLEAAGAKEAFVRAIRAAADRSRELGK